MLAALKLAASLLPDSSDGSDESDLVSAQLHRIESVTPDRPSLEIVTNDSSRVFIVAKNARPMRLCYRWRPSREPFHPAHNVPPMKLVMPPILAAGLRAALLLWEAEKSYPRSSNLVRTTGCTSSLRTTLGEAPSGRRPPSAGWNDSNSSRGTTPSGPRHLGTPVLATVRSF